MVPEIWKPVSGFEGRYDVSNLGRVRSLRFVNNATDRLRNEPLIMSPNNSSKYGHKSIMIARKRVLLHRLVAEHFIGLCPEGMECAHLDGDATNNAASNLKWCTQKENHFHKRTHGTHGEGVNHSIARLSEQDVRDIRILLGTVNARGVARRYGMSSGAIYSIKYNKSWKHLK